MKKQLLFLALFLLSTSVFAQKQQMFTVSGGYAWANVFESNYIEEDFDITGTGWRINGLYEFNPNEGPLAWGIALGYISLSGDHTNDMGEKTKLTVGTIPVYLSPKYMFGNEQFKGFIKATAGMQFANLDYEGPSGTTTSEDFGFYGGGGVGLLYFIKDNVFLNLEYELAYLSNSYYRDGIMQSGMGGVGFKF